MGIASNRLSSHWPTSVHDHWVTLQSRKLTPLPVARGDSLERREVLSWSEPTLSHSVPTERTSPSARSTGALLPPGKLAEQSSLARRAGPSKTQLTLLFRATHYRLSYSALALLRIGMPGSASFQS